MEEGWTPLLDAPRTAARIGCRRLLIKDESQNPTGSFKDRSASYTISHLRQEGAVGVVLNSTGNASAAFAAYAARASLPCVCVVPRDVLYANVLQIQLAGAELVLLDDWTDASRLSDEIAQVRGFQNVSASRTPHRIIGKMTIGYEIVEQLDGRFPDYVVCPTGGGTALLALKRAFEGIKLRGEVDGDVPRLVISQYEGCSPLVEAFRSGLSNVKPWPRIDTPRGGMRTPAPTMAPAVLDAISQGGAYAINPMQARKAVREMSSTDGVCLGLEAGTALAAVELGLKWEEIAADACIVIINSASVLKSELAAPDVFDRTSLQWEE